MTIPNRPEPTGPVIVVIGAGSIGSIAGVIHAAGVSPSQASPETILSVDLYGTALVLEEFGNLIAAGFAGVVIASQSGSGSSSVGVGASARSSAVSAPTR